MSEDKALRRELEQAAAARCPRKQPLGSRREPPEPLSGAPGSPGAWQERWDMEWAPEESAAGPGAPGMEGEGPGSDNGEPGEESEEPEEPPVPKFEGESGLGIVPAGNCGRGWISCDVSCSGRDLGDSLHPLPFPEGFWGILSLPCLSQ